MPWRARALVILGCLLLAAAPAGADDACDDGTLVGPGTTQETGVARPATGGREALLGVRRSVSVQGVRTADGQRPWVRIEAPDGYDHVEFGHSFGARGSDLLLVDAPDRSCSALRLQAAEGSRGRTRWASVVPVPLDGQRITGWSVPAVADVTGDGVDDVVVELRTSTSDRAVRNPDGRLEAFGGAGGAVHLVDGATGGGVVVAAQAAPAGAGPFAAVVRGLLLTGTSGTGTSEVVARRDGRVVWRNAVPSQAGSPLVRESRVGPVLASSSALLGTLRTHQVVQLDARTGGVVWQRTWSDAGPLQVLESGGDLLVRLGGTGQLEAVSARDGATRWATDDDLGGGELLVGDLDRDGAADIYVPGGSGSTAVLSGRTGAALHPEVLSHLTGDVTAVGDLDGDGHDDLVATLSEQDLQEQVFGGGAAVPDGLTALSGRTAQVLWTTGERPGRLAAVGAVVRPGQGRDVFLHDVDTGVIALRSGATGRLVWQVDLDD